MMSPWINPRFRSLGIGGHGGNDNAPAGGHASLLSHNLSGGSDTIATGSNSAGNGGNGYFAGSLIDVSVAIYAPINIAIAGPHSTAVADQVNNVHIDQNAVRMPGVGGDLAATAISHWVAMPRISCRIFTWWHSETSHRSHSRSHRGTRRRHSSHAKPAQRRLS